MFTMLPRYMALFHPERGIPGYAMHGIHILNRYRIPPLAGSATPVHLLLSSTSLLLHLHLQHSHHALHILLLLLNRLLQGLEVVLHKRGFAVVVGQGF